MQFPPPNMHTGYVAKADYTSIHRVGFCAWDVLQSNWDVIFTDPPTPHHPPGVFRRTARISAQTWFFRDGVTRLESPIEIMTQINQKDTKTNSGNDTSRFKCRKNGFDPIEAVTSLLPGGGGTAMLLYNR